MRGIELLFYSGNVIARIVNFLFSAQLCVARTIARKLLKLPMLAYVDDYFAVDRAESAEAAVQVFARLVRACLGDDALSEQKLECGNPLIVLGVEIELSGEGATFWPAQEKVNKWTAAIDTFLAHMRMSSGEASKLAGQLQWASQSAFRRLGRAMLRPIIDQIRAGSSEVQRELELALRWWREVLQLQLKEMRPWSGNNGRQVNITRCMHALLASCSHSFVRCTCSATRGAPRLILQR